MPCGSMVISNRFGRARSILRLGTRLVDAAKAQSEFEFTGIDGTLIGLWSPGFSSAFGVAGYHFHFLSDDRRHGGHLLEVEAGPLRLRVEALMDFHLSLPSSEAFLKADLSKNTAEELAYAERSHWNRDYAEQSAVEVSQQARRALRHSAHRKRER